MYCVHLDGARGRRIARGGVPGRTRRNVPVSMAGPIPIRLRNDFPLRLDERGHGTLAILVRGAAADTSEGGDAVVNDHTNLRFGMRLAGQDCERVSTDDLTRRAEKLTLELNVGGEWCQMR